MLRRVYSKLRDTKDQFDGHSNLGWHLRGIKECKHIEGWKGCALNYSCRFNKALPLWNSQFGLILFPPSTAFRNLGAAYRSVGRYEEAIKQSKKALELSPNDLFAHLSLAITYIKLGCDEEAKAEAAEVLKIHPKFSLDYYARVHPLKCQSVLDDHITCLRKAGLK